MNYLPHVAEVLNRVNRNEPLVEQLNFIFTNLSGYSRRAAYELSDSELYAYAVFFDLVPKEKRKVKSITFTKKRR